MRQLPSSRGFTVVAFAVATFGMVVLLYGEVRPFSAYWRLFGGLLPWAGPGGWFAALVFVAGLAAASASCLLDAERRAPLLLHRVDYFFVLVGLVSTWSLTAGFFERGRGILFWHLVCLTALAVTGCYLWATTLVRWRAGTLGRTVLWPRVFRTLPLNQFTGIFILVVVVVASLWLGIGAVATVDVATSYSTWEDIALSSWLPQWFTFVALPSLTLAVVAVLSLNILSITAAKERAVEEKLREERFRAELITNVTHDIRTPLTSIVNYVDLIDKLDLDDPKLTEYTDVLGRKADRLKVLIGDLLDASRASAGNLPVHLEPIEVTEILAQIAGDFDDAFTARDLTWVGPPTRHWRVQADGEHLWRILENLVGNIVKYAKPGTCVHADLYWGPAVVRLQLTNLTVEPIFLSAEQLTAQFVRGDAARHSEGSGLGLFIADRLARLMGASLALAVDGDRFTASIELPAVRTHGISDRPYASQPAPREIDPASPATSPLGVS